MNKTKDIHGPFFKSCCELARRFQSQRGVLDVQVGEKYSEGMLADYTSLRFNVLKKKPRSQLKSNDIIPKKVAGIRTDVIEHKVQLHSPVSVNPNMRVRPVFGGIKVHSSLLSNTDFGTMGCILKKDGLYFGLTNYHVLFGINMEESDAWSYTGRSVNQPQRENGEDPIGKICATFNRYLDYALFTITPTVNGEQAVNKIPGVISGFGRAELGMRLLKAGAVSGLTHGIVDGRSCFDKSRIVLRYDNSMNNEDNYISRGGDSGSAWLLPGMDGTLKIVALHYGGVLSENVAYATLYSSINASLKNQYTTS